MGYGTSSIAHKVIRDGNTEDYMRAVSKRADKGIIWFDDDSYVILRQYGDHHAYDVNGKNVTPR